MNIIFLEAVQNFGGARKSTLELAKRLKDRGNNILIIDFWGSCIPFVEKAQEFELALDFIDKRDTPFLLSDGNRFRILGNYCTFLFLWLRYRKIIRSKISNFQANVIVVNNTKTLSLLSKSSQYKIAYFARGWFLPKSINRINKFLIKKLVSIYIAVSQSTRQAIYAGGYAPLDKIYVVQNAFEFHDKSNSKAEKENNFWHKSESDRPFVLLHSGGFLQSKGHLLIVEIAKRLKEERVKFKIYMTGIIYKGNQSKQFYDEVIHEINQYGLSDCIEIVLNKSDVKEYFLLADVLLHPSETEGLPRVVMEAMAYGKPVIGNPVGGMTDFIINNYTGYLTNYNDIDDYIRYTLSLINDKGLYERLSINARSLIKSTYTPDNQCSSFENVTLK